MVSSSIAQLRQTAVPPSWQPVRRAGGSSVIPHSHVAFIASPPPSPPSSVSGATASRGLTLGPRAKQSNVIVSRAARERSEEHTSELQSLAYLVCRLLLEKKKTQHDCPTDCFA